MSCVLPGVLDVFASFDWLVSILISEDLPTFERPMKAYSGLSGLGQPSTDGLLITYTAFVISIDYIFPAGAFHFALSVS